MTKIILAATVLALTMGSQAGAAPVNQMINRYEALNEMCRGGYGNDPKTNVACVKRERIGHGLKSAGWCLWPDGDKGLNEANWHRCTSTGAE